jgi:hypothetical protein
MKGLAKCDKCGKILFEYEAYNLRAGKEPLTGEYLALDLNKDLCEECARDFKFVILEWLKKEVLKSECC